jgi:hypothetical protein
VEQGQGQEEELQKHVCSHALEDIGRGLQNTTAKEEEYKDEACKLGPTTTTVTVMAVMAAKKW